MIPNDALLLETRNQPCLSEAPEFQKLVTTTNRVAAKFNGSRDTCILTSFALNDTLQRLGYNSRPLRIEAAVFPDDRKFYGTILGRWLLKTNGLSTLRSIRQTKKNGRRQYTSARSQFS